MKREKPTLQMEWALIEKAEWVARGRGTPVSGMLTGFLNSLEKTLPAGQRYDLITTSRLRGSPKLEGGRPLSDEDDYLRHLKEKHE